MHLIHLVTLSIQESFVLAKPSQIKNYTTEITFESQYSIYETFFFFFFFLRGRGMGMVRASPDRLYDQPKAKLE
jgi:hypothetical protein